MEIRRDTYLNDLVVRKHNGLVKVITGIRRSGKSHLVFKIFRNRLREQGADENVVEIAFDRRRSQSLRDPDVLLDHLEPQFEGAGVQRRRGTRARAPARCRGRASADEPRG